MPTKPVVLIVGAGKMGQVIRSAIQPRVSALHFWDIDSSKVVGELPIEKAA